MRLQLFDRGNIACPLCQTRFTRNQASAGRTVTLEHVPPKALGGQPRCLTCKRCNAGTGRGIDQAAAMSVQKKFPVTVDILGKRDSFMLSLEGKALTPPFRGFTKQDWQLLQNSPSRNFTMSLRIADPTAVAASALKTAYLALFSLLGRRHGYEYVRGNALAPVRRLIFNSDRKSAVRRYVSNVPDSPITQDILLVTQPCPCWIVRVDRHLVTLPLSGDTLDRTPLWNRSRQTGNNSILVEGRASWAFQAFGAFHSVSVYLAAADRVESLLGLKVGGSLSNGSSLEGICIMHAGESAILLCTDAVLNV